MLGRSPRHPAAKSWRNFLSGLTAALLLLPVPAYATLSWGTPWTINMGGIGGTAWTETDTPSGNSEYLFITAQTNSTALPTQSVITFSTTVTQTGNVTESFTPNISGLDNLTMTAGNVTYQVTAAPVKKTTISGSPSYSSGNQFSGTGPSATQTGGAITSTPNHNPAAFSVSVTFTFASASTWTAGTVSSSSFTVFFNGT